ncbi:MAG: response regulator [Myxococcota bacterium]|nr:response regulator [Myxococcota bacterium]
MHHRVLIVDDYPDAAELACLLLSLLGSECRTASCGREALAAAVAFEPDVALLDLELPDLTGYEVARQLRILAAGRPLYIAAVTGRGAAADRQRTLAAGFDDHVLKPADVTVLQAILQRAEQVSAGERRGDRT